MTGWLPLSYLKHPKPALEWAWLGSLRLTDPFFSDTISRSFRRPYASLFRRRTSLDLLAADLAKSELLRPAGFIFHISRCGSTLICQALTALPEVRVLSEPPAVGGALRNGATDHDIRSTILAHCLKWSSDSRENAVVIKFDCWDIGHAERIAALFPETPRIFVVRDPLEVLVSQMSQPGSWTLPGVLPADIPGINEAGSRQEVCARAIGHFLRTGAWLAARRLVEPVDYRTLPGELFTRIVPLFGLPLGEDVLARAAAVCRLNAKNPYVTFTPDSQTKIDSVTPGLRAMAERFIAPAWREMQRLIENSSVSRT